MSPLDENLLDDNLTPLERLEKFYATEEIFERQAVLLLGYLILKCLYLGT